MYYVTQPDVAPPTIVLFVNNTALIDEMYQRYMINRLRELLPYAEVPIRLVLRGKDTAPKEGRPPESEELTPLLDATPRRAKLAKKVIGRKYAPVKSAGGRKSVRAKVASVKAASVAARAKKPTRRPK